MSNQEDLDRILRDRLIEIYGSVPEKLGAGLRNLIKEVSGNAVNGTQQNTIARSPGGLWNEKDCVLITYADQVRDQQSSPLAALKSFLCDFQLTELTNTVHLLPFFPWTSDDGFSISDYRRVKPEYGNWDDIKELGNEVDLMFDLVLNHCSAQHEWFQQFLAGQKPYCDYFIDADPQIDWSGVVRPRSSPLLTPVSTTGGVKHVWTTFSADQVDLNYKDPGLMLEMLSTLVDYARRGARIIRLDAIAYLWKEAGTSCVHLQQTHAVVKLMRRLLDLTFPGTLVLTETNVPHAENMSYFGAGDEAHIVYQFSLPPLLLDAIHSGDTEILSDWLASLEPPFPQTTFLNFTASHDGVGVRPLEGLVSDQRLEKLVSIVRRHGGAVSTRRRSDGSDSPYELNITYMDAVADASRVSPEEHARRFLATQAIMLALRGLPAVYFHSLTGTPNDIEGMQVTGRNRSINRRKFVRSELDDLLADRNGGHAGRRMRAVFNGYRKLLSRRRELPAMHPDASQRVLRMSQPGIFGFVRGEDLGERHAVSVVANLSGAAAVVKLPVAEAETMVDHLRHGGSYKDNRKEVFKVSQGIPLEAFQVRWLGRC